MLLYSVFMAKANLEGARAKVERAKQHIRDLDAQRIAFLGDNPYRTTPEFHPEYSATAYFLDEYAPIPEAISLVAGDALHNLRAALDYVVYAFASKGLSPAERAKLYFPISKSAEDYNSESLGKTAGVPKYIKKRIDRLKPYKGGNDLLWGLHRLNIIDKHRLLVTVGVNVTEVEMILDTAFLNKAFPGMFTLPLDLPKQSYKFPAPKPISPMEKDALLYGVKGNFEGDNHIDFTFDIAIGEVEVFEGQLLVETLKELADLVESIVFQFSG